MNEYYLLVNDFEETWVHLAVHSAAIVFSSALWRNVVWMNFLFVKLHSALHTLPTRSCEMSFLMKEVQMSLCLHWSECLWMQESMSLRISIGTCRANSVHQLLPKTVGEAAGSIVVAAAAADGSRVEWRVAGDFGSASDADVVVTVPFLLVLWVG